MRRGRVGVIRRDLRVLVIDECSMLSAAFFEKIDAVLRIIKGNDAPFGGTQIILFGDFHQLPPVFKGDDDKRLLFESPAYMAIAAGHTVELKTIYRQTDSRLLDLLLDIRSGTLTPKSKDLITYLHRELPESETPSLHLFCHNFGVDALNANSLTLLPGDPVTYKALDKGLAQHVEKLNHDTLIPQKLQLKVGALVMLLTNIPERGLGNGSRGTVTSVTPEGALVDFGRSQFLVKPVTIQFCDATGAELASRTQIPLKLSWAATIHKSQGQSIKHLHVDLDGAFAPGQG